MKFIIGQLHNPDFDPERTGWQRLKEPGLKESAVIGSVLSLILGSLTYWIVSTLGDFSFEQLFDEFDLWVLLLTAALIAIHERLHAAFHPGGGLTQHTLYGVIPQSLIIYAYYDGSVTRRRSIAILVAPFIGLTAIPLFVALLWPAAAQVAGFVAVMNAAFSALDLFNAVLVVLHVPSGAMIRNQGWKSYWRLADMRES